MRRLFALAFIWAAVCVSNAAPVNKDIGIPMDKGTLIEIGKYEPQIRLYEVIDVHNYGQGPWYTTPDQLVHAVNTLNLKRLLRDPQSIVTNQYTTDNLLLVVPDDVAEILRKKKAQDQAPQKPKARAKSR